MSLGSTNCIGWIENIFLVVYWGFLYVVSFYFHSTTTASEDDVSSRYPRTDRSGFSRYSREANVASTLASSSTLEKKIEDLEKVWIMLFKMNRTNISLGFFSSFMAAERENKLKSMGDQ
jgi:hypothetical protein